MFSSLVLFFIGFGMVFYCLALGHNMWSVNWFYSPLQYFGVGFTVFCAFLLLKFKSQH